MYLKEAAVCLSEHTEKVRVQNQQLRQELLMLIRKTQALYEHKRHLDEQKQQLLTERQYAEDLKSLRVEKKLASLSEKRKADDGQKELLLEKMYSPWKEIIEIFCNESVNNELYIIMRSKIK